MKESTILCAGLCIALAFTGCKSSESTYKKAHEKTKAQEPVQTSAQTEVPVVAPLTPVPVTQTQVVDNVDNATVCTEDATVVSGSGLGTFSVVVDSFGLKANAERLQHTLQSADYGTQIAYNSARNMYRVVTTTHADRASAAVSRNQFRPKCPDVWLSYKK